MRCFKMVLLVGPLAVTALTAADPFSGHWKLNVEKSRLPPPVPRSQLVYIEADTLNIRIVEEGIDDKGDLFKLTISGGFDGKHYGVLNSPSLDTVWFRRLDDHTILGEATQSGKEIGTGTAVVSKNRKTLTVSFSLNDARGKEIRAKAVLDKQ